MEELEGIRGAEGGRDHEFHKIPTQGSSHTSQTTYIRAPSQGLPTTTTTNLILESPNKFNTSNTPALTILFKMLREDGRPLPVGSFTERSVARKVYSSTGVAVERVTMITPTDALIEFAPRTLVVAIAQVLHQINEWEDIPVWVTCLMGSKNYIMQLCRERAENEDQKRVWEAEAEKMREDQQEQQEKLSELIDKVNDQAQLVGEMQQNNLAIPKESAPRISLLQGQAQDPFPAFLAASTLQPEFTVLSIHINNRTSQGRTRKIQICQHFQEKFPLLKGRWSTIILFFSYRC